MPFILKLQCKTLLSRWSWAYIAGSFCYLSKLLMRHVLNPLKTLLAFSHLSLSSRFPWFFSIQTLPSCCTVQGGERGENISTMSDVPFSSLIPSLHFSAGRKPFATSWFEMVTQRIRTEKHFPSPVSYPAEPANDLCSSKAILLSTSLCFS